MKPIKKTQASAVDTQPMITPDTARPRFCVLPDFFNLESDTCPRIDPMKERKPADKKIRAREVTKDAMAKPLPAFASCSVGESAGVGLVTPEGINSLTLCLVNYSGLDPKVAQCAVILCEVEDDFNNNPSDGCDARGDC